MNRHADSLPCFRHASIGLAALQELITRDQWVMWRSKRIEVPGKPARTTKIPIDANSGANAKVNESRTWASFAKCYDGAVKHGLQGVGFVLDDADGFSGLDIDKCVDPQTGAIEPWAAAIVAFGETYCEISPSRTGLRFFILGKVEHATKCDPAQVELYGTKRFLTVTGYHVEGAPVEINPAPRTIQAVLARVEQFRTKDERLATAEYADWQAKQSRQAKVEGGNFFRNVNDKACAEIDRWAQKLFPQAKRSGTGYRVSSKLLGRDLEEDISITQDGVVDFGVHDMGDANAGRRTPINLVMEWGGHDDPVTAARWLCSQLGVTPEEMGWREAQSTGAGNVAGSTKNNPSEQSKPQKWAEPKPLPDGLLPVPPFDVAFLPPALSDWAKDIAERMQCALDFVGVTILVALGALVGRKIGIRPQRKTDWLEVANIWGCLVGRPGAMKSPAMNEALKVLNRLEGDARKANEEALEKYERAKKLYDMKASVIEQNAKKAFQKGNDYDLDNASDDPPENPTIRRYIVNDCTYEALGVTLAHNPQGVLAFRDELVSLLKQLSDERNAAARGFFLTAWNGTSGYSFDRIIRGHTHIEAACLSLLGSTQPGRLAEFMKASQGAGDDGLLQRFSFLIFPDQPPAFCNIDRYPDSEARKSASEAFERLDKLSAASVEAEIDDHDSIPFLRFSDDAQEAFNQWRIALEDRLRSGDLSPELESHLAKFRKLVPSLALTSHLANGGVGRVSMDALLRALAIAEYAEAHARRCYAAGLIGEIAAAKAILKRIRKGDLEEGFTLREIHQKGWANLANHEAVAAGLRLLVDYDWLAIREVRTTGRPRSTFLINPAAKR